MSPSQPARQAPELEGGFPPGPVASVSRCPLFWVQDILSAISCPFTCLPEKLNHRVGGLLGHGRDEGCQEAMEGYVAALLTSSTFSEDTSSASQRTPW